MSRPPSWLTRADPRRLAIVTDDEEVTFAALQQKVAALPLPPRDRPIALTAQPDLPSLVRLHALMAAGHTVVPLHPRATAAEVAAQCRLVGAVPFAEASTARAPGPDNDALAILFTSGSTGTPRGVELSRAAFAAAAAASAERLGWRADDRWLLALPWAHVGGLSVIVRCLLAEVPVVLPGADGARADLLTQIERHRITLVSLVPAQLARLLEAPQGQPPSCLRVVLLGGQAAPPALVAEARRRGWPVAPTYGLSECCAQVATLPPDQPPDGSCGAPLPGYQVRIVDDQIQVKSPSLMTRYLPSGDPARDGDGYFHTRDLGRLDERGHLHVLGRADDVIVTGGEKVMPLEVESVLGESPDVAEACVFAVADARFGQTVACALVAAPARSIDRAPDEPALLALLTERLAAYKRPRKIAWVAALPRLPSGKVDRRALAAQPPDLRAWRSA